LIDWFTAAKAASKIFRDGHLATLQFRVPGSRNPPPWSGGVWSTFIGHRCNEESIAEMFDSYARKFA